MRKIILALVLTTAVTGCGMPWQDGQLLLMGDAEGIRAFGDMQNGLKAEGDSYFKLREHQETERSRRKCSNCGFLQKLMGGSTQVPSGTKVEGK